METAKIQMRTSKTCRRADAWILDCAWYLAPQHAYVHFLAAPSSARQSSSQWHRPARHLARHRKIRHHLKLHLLRLKLHRQ